MSKILITEDQQKNILNKLKEIEKAVDIEIIPMIVRSSSVTGHISIILFLLFSICLFLLDIKSLFWLSALQEMLAIAGILIVTYIFSVWLSKLEFLQRLLTSNKDEELQVKNRAELEFYKGAFHSTSKRNAVLLFVSLMEKRSFIFSDIEVKNKLSESQIANIKKALFQNLDVKTVDICLINAMNLLFENLKDHMKVTSPKDNSITDQIIIKD